MEKLTGGPQDEEIFCRAGAIIKQGGLVAFPTETVYGLGGDALRPDAAKRIYAAKGRPSDNPLIVHIAAHQDMEQLVKSMPEEAYRLAEAFWPGPLTLILGKNDRVPLETTGGLSTVAIREPDHPAALSFIAKAGGFIAAPSANRSGRPSPTSASHVMEDLAGEIDMILDGGETAVGIESTILDLSEAVPTILRPGFITQEALSAVIGPVRMDPGLLREDTAVRPKAPGMKYRHYAPRAEVILVSGDKDAVIRKINELSLSMKSTGKKVGIISSDETKDCYPHGLVIPLGSRRDEKSIARHLYDVLRSFDRTDVSVIYSESFEGPGLLTAVMNRLLKAAGHKEIRV